MLATTSPLLLPLSQNALGCVASLPGEPTNASPTRSRGCLATSRSPWPTHRRALSRQDPGNAGVGLRLLKHNGLLKRIMGTLLYGKLCSWLKNLRWVHSPALPVTCVELALDFEAFSGSRLPGETLAEKGRQIGALMRAFNDVGLLDDRPAFAGRWRQGVCSLRCLGAPPMPGISHRPVFAGEPVTVAALNNIPASCLGRE